MIWKLLKLVFERKCDKKPSITNADASNSQVRLYSQKKKYNARNVLTVFVTVMLLVFVIIFAIYIGYIIPNMINNKFRFSNSTTNTQSFRDEVKSIVQGSICFNHAQHMSQRGKNEQSPLYQFDLCAECYDTSKDFEQFCLFQSLVKRVPEFSNNKFPISWFKDLNICTYEQLKCNEDSLIKEITLQHPLIPKELPYDSFKNFTQLNSLSLIGNVTGELQTLPQTVQNLYLKDTNLNLALKSLFQLPISHISLISNTQIQDLDNWHNTKLSTSATHISLNQPSLQVNKNSLLEFLSNNLHIKSTLIELNFKSSKVDSILANSNTEQVLKLKELGYRQLKIFFY
jgi:hypothetical protein